MIRVGLLLLVLGTPAAHAQDLRTMEIPRHLYIDSLSECADCVTFTIIISDTPVQQPIAQTFRVIADALGRKNAAAMVSWQHALQNYRFFKNSGCDSFTDMAGQVVVYIDRSEKYCQSFPYEKDAQLMALISLISSNVGDAKRIQNEGWRYTTKQAIATYAAENKVVDSVKNIAFRFIDYIGNAAGRLQK